MLSNKKYFRKINSQFFYDGTLIISMWQIIKNQQIEKKKKKNTLKKGKRFSKL